MPWTGFIMQGCQVLRHCLVLRQLLLSWCCKQVWSFFLEIRRVGVGLEACRQWPGTSPQPAASCARQTDHYQPRHRRTLLQTSSSDKHGRITGSDHCPICFYDIRLTPINTRTYSLQQSTAFYGLNSVQTAIRSSDFCTCSQGGVKMVDAMPEVTMYLCSSAVAKNPFSFTTPTNLTNVGDGHCSVISSSYILLCSKLLLFGGSSAILV